MKTSINTYSFGRVTNKDGNPVNQMEMIDIAKEIGFDAIEFVGIQVPEGYELMQYVEMLKKHCKEVCLEISGYTIGADFNNDNTVEYLKNEIKVAAALGADKMRHDICYSLPEGKTYFDMIPEYAKKVTEVSEYAKQFGIKTCTENHGYISQDADRVIALKEAVKSDNFGLLCDFGNFMCADETSIESVAKVAKYAIHVHAKDFKYKSKDEVAECPAGFFPTRGGNYLCGCALGDGVVNVPKCVEIIKEANYNGYITLEFEGPFNDPLDEIKKGFALLKNAIK